MRIAINRCALSVALALAGASVDAADWTVRDLGTFGGSTSIATGINASGQVVGNADTTGNATYHAFISAPNGGALTDLGTLGGSSSSAGGINASGQVVGYATTTGNAATHAFISAPDGGTLRDLGTLGGSASFAGGINASGQVVGNAQTNGNATYHGFISAPNGGTLRDLGTLGGSSSYPAGINASGQVVGYAYTTGNAAQHAFISAANGGALSDLGTLGGSASSAYGINASGRVVGTAFTAGNATHAFISAPNGGALTDLGTLGGSSSNAYGINASSQVVGDAYTTGNAQHAFISTSDGAMLDFSTLAAAGRTLKSARAINDYGQVVGLDANNHAFIATPNAKWGGACNNSWDIVSNWNFGGIGSLTVTPDFRHDVVLNPTGSVTVLGSANATVASLLVAGNSGQFVTLDLNGGSTVTLSGTTLGNNGTMAGSGRLGGNLTVQSGGRVYATDYQSMQLAGNVSNSGRIDIQSRNSSAPASLQVGGTLTNAGSGETNLMNTDVFVRGGTVNGGRVSIAGFTTVSGVINNQTGGQVNVSGISAHAIFWDNFQNNGSVTVTGGSTATFFGLVNGKGDFLGSGTKEFAGGYAPGSSPGQVTMAGDIVFSAGTLTMELGGTTPGTGHDKVVFLGPLPVRLEGAALNVEYWGGWTAGAGQTYDLFDWGGGVAGQFSSVGLPALASGLVWNTSDLYAGGSLSVAAVPEPETYAMLLVGLGVMGFIARRKLQNVA